MVSGIASGNDRPDRLPGQLGALTFMTLLLLRQGCRYLNGEGLNAEQNAEGNKEILYVNKVFNYYCLLRIGARNLLFLDGGNFAVVDASILSYVGGRFLL